MALTIHGLEMVMGWLETVLCLLGITMCSLQF